MEPLMEETYSNIYGAAVGANDRRLCRGGAGLLQDVGGKIVKLIDIDAGILGGAQNNRTPCLREEYCSKGGVSRWCTSMVRPDLQLGEGVFVSVLVAL
jgi:hypothetical protein